MLLCQPESKVRSKQCGNPQTALTLALMHSTALSDCWALLAHYPSGCLYHKGDITFQMQIERQVTCAAR